MFYTREAVVKANGRNSTDGDRDTGIADAREIRSSFL
jgi:hypothetical protein